MADCNISVFNRIEKYTDTPCFTLEEHQSIFSMILNMVFGGAVGIGELNPTLRNIQILLPNIITQCVNMKYNDSYGFLHNVDKTKIKDQVRFCIPFLRREVPIENSNFSSILISLFLTLKHYIEHKYNIDDAYNLYNNNDLVELIFTDKQISQQILKEIYKPSIESIDINTKLSKILTIIQSTELMFMSNYLYHMNKPNFYLSSKQTNISFQDIISNNYKQFQVGYTGTIDGLYLYSYDVSETLVFREKIRDNRVNNEVTLALNGFGCLSPGVMIQQFIY